MVFKVMDGKDPDFIKLCTLLDDALNKLAGHIIDRSKYVQYNMTEKIHDVIIAYDGAFPVACAAFKHYEEDVAEIKRVFVREDYRGRGISKSVMTLLEASAIAKGYKTLILETTAPLVQSIGLYKKHWL